MRRTYAIARIAACVAGATAILASACSGGFSATDNAVDASSDAPPVDGALGDTSQTDAGGDGSVRDTGGGDGAADACRGTWCECVPAGFRMCDDFDKPGETVGQGWNADASVDEGGVLVIEADAASSPPDSVFASVPTDIAAGRESSLTEQLGPLSTNRVRVALDLYVPATGSNCLTNEPEFVRVDADISVIQLGAVMQVALGLHFGVPLLRLKSFGQTVDVPVPADAGILGGQWVRVRLEVSLVGADGGTTLGGSLFVVGAGTNDDLPATAVATVSHFAPPPSANYISWASVGALDYAASSSGACQVFVDNVAVYQP